MNLNPIRANMTELDLCDGKKVLFSYRTPVAAIVVEGGAIKAYRTSYKWSPTTTRHINQWCRQYDGERPQEFFDGLVK